MTSPRYRKKKCICDTKGLLGQITGTPKLLRASERCISHPVTTADATWSKRLEKELCLFALIPHVDILTKDFFLKIYHHRNHHKPRNTFFVQVPPEGFSDRGIEVAHYGLTTRPKKFNIHRLNTKLKNGIKIAMLFLVNQIRLNLFTERNSDGTGYLVLRGKDIYDRYERRINDNDIRAICLYIRESPRIITKLDLCYNRITDKGFFKLLKKLLVKGRSSVINLNIMNNKLTEKSILYLSKYAKYVKLKYLRLNGNDFGVNGPEYFAKFLRDNKTVQFCDIGETNMTLNGVAHVITALRKDHGVNTSLKVLDFSRIVPLFNRYSYETKWLAYHIEYLLERNSSIIELHLQKNEFLSHDVEYFARGLRRNNTLLYLDLGYNKIGDYGIELIAKYLKEKPSLILLNVAGNGIKDTGARALSFGIPYSKLRVLDISDNKLTECGLLDILNTIKKPYYLRFLNIWGNKFGPESCEVIKRMLESGALFQHTIDVFIYEVDEVLYAAYYPNPADRNKHLYYCESDYGYALPICHIKRNEIGEKKRVKVDCKQRKKLDKTNTFEF